MKRLSDIAPQVTAWVSAWSPVIVSLVVVLVAVGIRLQEPVTIKTVRNMAFDQYQRWRPRAISRPPL